MRAALARALGALCLCAVVAGAAACAPLSSFRPASGIMDDRGTEVGMGGTVISPRPYVDEPMQGAGQIWLSRRAAKKLTLTGVGAIEPQALALGGAARVDVVKTDRFAAGPEMELGFLWAALHVGAALRLWGENWIYTAPRIGNRGQRLSLEIPAGASFHVYEGVMLRAEYRVSWAGELSYYQQRRMFGAALAIQF